VLSDQLWRWASNELPTAECHQKRTEILHLELEKSVKGMETRFRLRSDNILFDFACLGKLLADKQIVYNLIHSDQRVAGQLQENGGGATRSLNKY